MKTKKINTTRAITFSIPMSFKKDLERLPARTKSKKITDLITSCLDDYKKDPRFQRGEKKSNITLSIPLDVINSLKGLDRSALLTELLNTFEVD